MSHIVVCSQEDKPELALPFPIWQHVVRLLRTYKVPVYLMGDKGYRADYGAWTENSIVSNASPEDKATLLTQAALVVGTPNQYTDLAARAMRPVLLLCPMTVIDIKKYFPYTDERFGLVRCHTGPLHLETVLAGCRQLIGKITAFE